MSQLTFVSNAKACLPKTVPSLFVEAAALWCEKWNIHGFIMFCKSLQHGFVIANYMSIAAVPGMTIAVGMWEYGWLDHIR